MKKNNLHIIIIVTILVLINIWIIIAVLQPKYSLSSTFFMIENQPQPTTFQDISYSGPSLTTPKKLSPLSITTTPVPTLNDQFYDYCQIQNYEIDATEIYNFYGQKCDYYFDGSQSDYGYLMATSNYHPENEAEIALASALNNPPINLLAHESDPPSTQVIAPESAQFIADSFILSLYGDIGYLSDPSPAPSPATSIPFNYVPHHDGHPVYAHEKNSLSIILDVNGDQSISGSFPSTTISLTPNDQQYSTISLNQALANVRQGHAYVDSYSDFNYGDVNQSLVDDLSALTSISLTSASLQYRLNTEQTFAIPCYHFSGTAKDPHGNVMDLTIITPALNFTIV